MALNASVGGQKFAPVPAGNHVARCYRIIEIGTVQEDFQGEMKEMKKVVVGFELPNETKEFKEGEGQKPFVVSREYTLSMNEKANLRHLIEGALGVAFTDEEAEGYDITSFVGESCLLNVIHKEGKKGSYAQIKSASPIPKGMTAPAAFNEPQILTYENWNVALFDSLPDFYKDKMKSSWEYKQQFKTTDITAEDSPF